MAPCSDESIDDTQAAVALSSPDATEIQATSAVSYVGLVEDVVVGPSSAVIPRLLKNSEKLA